MTFTVKQARVFRGLTQKEMAKKMGICRATYIKIEENPECATVKQAKMISDITEIPFDCIFFSN